MLNITCILQTKVLCVEGEKKSVATIKCLCCESLISLWRALVLQNCFNSEEKQPAQNVSCLQVHLMLRSETEDVIVQDFQVDSIINGSINNEMYHECMKDTRLF